MRLLVARRLNNRQAQMQLKANPVAKALCTSNQTTTEDQWSVLHNN